MKPLIKQFHTTIVVLIALFYVLSIFLLGIQDVAEENGRLFFRITMLILWGIMSGGTLIFLMKSWYKQISHHMQSRSTASSSESLHWKKEFELLLQKQDQLLSYHDSLSQQNGGKIFQLRPFSEEEKRKWTLLKRAAVGYKKKSETLSNTLDEKEKEIETQHQTVEKQVKQINALSEELDKLKQRALNKNKEEKVIAQQQIQLKQQDVTIQQLEEEIRGLKYEINTLLKLDEIKQAKSAKSDSKLLSS